VTECSEVGEWEECVGAAGVPQAGVCEPWSECICGDWKEGKDVS
jgi:hypothetical protein